MSRCVFVADAVGPPGWRPASATPFTAARQLADLFGHPVRVESFAGDLHAYLNRVDPFNILEGVRHGLRS